MESCTERIIAPMSSSRSISFFAFSPIFVCSCSSSAFPWAMVRNWFSSDFTTQNTIPKITTLTALTSTTAINVLMIPFFNSSNTSTCHKTMTSINANIGFKAFPQATFLLSCSIIIRNLRVHQSYTYSIIFFMLMVSEFSIFIFSLTNPAK